MHILNAFFVLNLFRFWVFMIIAMWKNSTAKIIFNFFETPKFHYDLTKVLLFLETYPLQNCINIKLNLFLKFNLSIFIPFLQQLFISSYYSNSIRIPWISCTKHCNIRFLEYYFNVTSNIIFRKLVIHHQMMISVIFYNFRSSL